MSAESSPTVNAAEKAAVENETFSKDVKVLNSQVHCKRQTPAEQAVHFDTADQLEQQASEQDLQGEGNGHEDEKNAESVSTPLETLNTNEFTNLMEDVRKRLVCNFCQNIFENEEELRNHTRTEHNSGRIRYTIK